MGKPYIKRESIHSFFCLTFYIVRLATQLASYILLYVLYALIIRIMNNFPPYFEKEAAIWNPKYMQEKLKGSLAEGSAAC
jgi:hypothetical protein